MISRADANRFIPRSILCLRNYSWNSFHSDFFAGITVGVVALPLALAFAIASNVPPQSGLYCAIIAGFIISALGGSTAQIGGPTGAFVVVVAGIVDKHGLDGLFVCTLMAGVMLVALGVTGLGAMVSYLPRPVILGFTNGIAVLIASTQIKDFFGLRMEHMPGDFIGRMRELWISFGSFSAAATALSIFSLLLTLNVIQKKSRIPAPFIVAVFGTALAVMLQLPVETINSRLVPSNSARRILSLCKKDTVGLLRLRKTNPNCGRRLV